LIVDARKLAVVGLSSVAALVSAMPAAAMQRDATHTPAAATGEHVAAARGCPGARARASRLSRARLQSVLTCLVNRERARRGIRALRSDRRLRRAAGRHARDMVRHRYFGHQRAGGPDLGTRLDRAGWRGSAAGETIAYGCGGASTARAAVRGWMASPGHSQLLLSGHYGRGGPGVAKRAPVDCGSGATWVFDVGRR
jgi:uncharacterized protein YkwD